MARFAGSSLCLVAAAGLMQSPTENFRSAVVGSSSAAPSGFSLLSVGTIVASLSNASQEENQTIRSGTANATSPEVGASVLTLSDASQEDNQTVHIGAANATIPEVSASALELPSASQKENQTVHTGMAYMAIPEVPSLNSSLFGQASDMNSSEFEKRWPFRVRSFDDALASGGHWSSSHQWSPSHFHMTFKAHAPKGGWNPYKYPDPSADPASCNVPETGSFICDPDGLLSPGGRMRVAHELAYVFEKRGFTLGVALMKEIEIKGLTPRGAVRNFAYRLLTRWKSLQPHNRAILVVSDTPRKAYVAVEPGARGSAEITPYLGETVVARMGEDWEVDHFTTLAVDALTSALVDGERPKGYWRRQIYDICFFIVAMLTPICIVCNLNYFPSFVLAIDHKVVNRPPSQAPGPAAEGLLPDVRGPRRETAGQFC